MKWRFRWHFDFVVDLCSCWFCPIRWSIDHRNWIDRKYEILKRTFQPSQVKPNSIHFFNSRISTTILAYKNRLTRLLWNRLVTLTHTRQDRTNYRQTVVANNRQNETPFNPNTSWEKKNERNTNKSTAKFSKQILNCEDLTFVWLQIQWTICLKNEISTYRTHFKFFEYVCLYKPQQISIFFLFSQQQMTQSQN